MKHVFLVFQCVILSIFAFSQIDHVSILLGKNESQVREYFDSLNKLKSAKYSIIRQDVSDDGSLLLKIDFLSEDESFYKCLGIGVSFNRKASKEICTYQRIYGTVQFAQNNLTYIKDNFAYKSENIWEKNLGKKSQSKVVASFERRDDVIPAYVIDFKLIRVK